MTYSIVQRNNLVKIQPQFYFVQQEVFSFNFIIPFSINSIAIIYLMFDFRADRKSLHVKVGFDITRNTRQFLFCENCRRSFIRSFVHLSFSLIFCTFQMNITLVLLNTMWLDLNWNWNMIFQSNTKCAYIICSYWKNWCFHFDDDDLTVSDENI